jgi:micrococcal nuclease
MPAARAVGRRRLALVVAVLGAALAACGRPTAGPTGPGAGVVRTVVDGDTIRVRLSAGDERVRLLGIDTPETHGAGGLVECYGAEATTRARQLLPAGTTVRLVRDREARDRYGRLLAYVYRADDGLFVNLALAEEGFADVLPIAPNLAHAGELDAAVGAARAAGRGLWRRCGSADVALR